MVDTFWHDVGTGKEPTMPWKECDTMSLREEFVSMAMSEGANLSFLCRRFGISRTTGSKWVHRYRAQGREGLRDSSRRPHHSPSRTEPWLEATVLKLRDRHPASHIKKAWFIKVS